MLELTTGLTERAESLRSKSKLRAQSASGLIFGCGPAIIEKRK